MKENPLSEAHDKKYVSKILSHTENLCNVSQVLYLCLHDAATYRTAAVRSRLVLNVRQIIESNTKTITKYTYVLVGANTFLHVGLRSAYSESWFFLRAKPSLQYKDTAFFTAWASIWSTLANCKQRSVLCTPWSLVRKRTIPTEQPPLVDEI
jgi:hypothetical protein